MNYLKTLTGVIFFSLFLAACSTSDKTPEGTDLIMTTDKGKIYIKLYDDTPKHKENFVKLAKEGFFDGMEFHRVIPNFMIQSGNPETKPDKQREPELKDSDAGYKLDAEIVPTHINTRGVLAAARDMNPAWQSSGSQFYIVTGKKVSDGLLDTAEINTTMATQSKLSYQFMEETPELKQEEARMRECAEKKQMDSVEAIRKRAMTKFQAYMGRKGFEAFKYTPAQRALYKEKGGYPTLDGQYTVFGEVLKGMEIADEISKVETEAPANRPKTPVRIVKTEVLSK